MPHESLQPERPTVMVQLPTGPVAVTKERAKALARGIVDQAPAGKYFHLTQINARTYELRSLPETEPRKPANGWWEHYRTGHIILAPADTLPADGYHLRATAAPGQEFVQMLPVRSKKGIKSVTFRRPR